MHLGVRKCMSCHKAIVVITGTAYYFDGYIYVYVYIYNFYTKVKV